MKITVNVDTKDGIADVFIDGERKHLRNFAINDNGIEFIYTILEVQNEGKIFEKRNVHDITCKCEFL